MLEILQSQSLSGATSLIYNPVTVVVTMTNA